MSIAKLSRVLVSALALGGLFVGFRGLTVEADRLDAVTAELNLATGVARTLPAPAREAIANHSLDCRSEFRRAATAIALADLSAANDADERRSRLQPAISAIKRQLGCSPEDGNAWFLLAVVTDPAEQHGVIYDYLNRSQRYAPREGWIIVRRIRFICSMVGLDVEAALGNVRRDFRTLLNDRQFAETASIFDNCKNGAERGFEEALNDVDPGIREAFVRQMAKNT